MKFYDISLPIDENMPVPGDYALLRPKIRTSEMKTSPNQVRDCLEIDLRTGTHILSPLIARQDGESVEQMSPSCVVTTCRVLDLTAINGNIGEQDLALFGIQPGEFILLKTQNSFYNSENHVNIQLTPEAALFLAKIGIKGIGIDAISLNPEFENLILDTMFERGCAILVGLRLKFVALGVYRLIALPLRLVGAKSSPVRAILIQGQ